ncbi:MAG: hypothetical protein RLP44_30945 [Aggregatilineales bacterium]
MATQVQRHQEPLSGLSTLVRGWERRSRLQQVIKWLPRSVIPALVVAVTLVILTRFRAVMSDSVLLTILSALFVAGIVATLVTIYFNRRSPIEAARRFDVTFGLGERVSTALELIDGKIRANDSLTDHQVNDAYERARKVDAKEGIPFEFFWRDWITVVVLAVIFALIFFLLPNKQVEAVLLDNSAAQAAIDNAEDAVMDIIEQVAADSALDDETRQELLETLQVNLETLQDENVSEEEALATLNDVQSALEERAEELGQDNAAQDEAIQSALESLPESAPQEGQNPENAGEGQNEAGAGADLSDALESLSDSMEGMTQEQLDDLADGLEQAANALEESNPEAAEALRDAAEAARNGDTEAAQQAMQEASDALQQQQAQQQQNQQSQEGLQQSAQQAQQAASEVAQAGQQQQQSQQGQQSQESQSGQQQQSQQGQSQQGQQSQEGQQGQQGEQAGQQGQSQSGQQQQGQQAGGQNQGEGEGNQPSEQAGGNGEGQAGQQGEQQASSSNQGDSSQAGNQAGSLSDDTSGGQQSEIQADPSGEGGERQYEQVFDPRSITGEGDTDIILQPDDSNETVREGQLSENPTGNVTVPYNQVFSDYSNAAAEALDRGYVPLGMRDIVRDYFSALAPSGSNNGGN